MEPDRAGNVSGSKLDGEVTTELRPHVIQRGSRSKSSRLVTNETNEEATMMILALVDQFISAAR